MRPTTRWLLVALALAVALFATPKVHALWQGSLSLSDLVVAYGGERRIVTLADGRAVEVVVHRKEKWCQCPGLGVIAQTSSAKPDSLFLLADALFRAFREEAAMEPAERRCLTVQLEVGDGMRNPMAKREAYTFSLWRRKTDQQWVFFGLSASAPIETRRLLLGQWAHPD